MTYVIHSPLQLTDEVLYEFDSFEKAVSKIKCVDYSYRLAVSSFLKKDIKLETTVFPLMFKEHTLNISITVQSALRFALHCHKNQVRMYTGEKYINHPVDVARKVSQVTKNVKVIAAAILHDVVEDTYGTLGDINKLFGGEVCLLVENLTDVSVQSDGNRKMRKLKDLKHTEKASPEAKTIKIADTILNSISIIANDPKFSRVYMREKRELLKVLREGDPCLLEEATVIVNEFFMN